MSENDSQYATFDPANLDKPPSLDLDTDLDHQDIVKLSRGRGGTMLSRKRMDLWDIDFHGDVFNGPVNWFFCYSEDDNILKGSDTKGRVYKVVMFTPEGKLLRPHQTVAPYDDDSEMCVYSEDSLIENPKDKAIKRAKDLATRSVDPEEEFRWY